MRLDFVTLGEVMIQLNAVAPGPLRSICLFERHVAGSEANVMIGLTRFGYTTGLITRVGRDEFGKAIINTLRGEGVDVSRVVVDPESPTGIYFIQRHYPVPGQSTVVYYRRGSAASKLSEEDVDDDYVKDAENVHITGITPALSLTCAKAVDRMYSLALKHGLSVSFDTNIRLKLWSDMTAATEVISKYLCSRIVFTNVEDLGFLYPGLNIKEAAGKILDRGAEVAVVKLGEKGAYALNKRGDTSVPAFRVPHVEDVIGAGDAFDSAFLASYLRDYDLGDCLKFGAAAGALVATVRGDIEALPTWNDLELFLESTKGEVPLR
jgi:sugar/nucleoside kinase (ribokinase family)